MKTIIISFLLLALGFSISINAQTAMEEKRIYIVDVTSSMEGKGSVTADNIFETVKKRLSDAINEIENPKTEIVIITFTDKIHHQFHGNANEKDKILKFISSLKVESGNTNIAKGWTTGIHHLDYSKINYMFLLTDGLHNTGVPKENFFSTLESWTTLVQNKYIFGFYVMLTKQAREPGIIDIVNKTNQLWLIESMDVNINFITTPMNIKANIRNTTKLILPYKKSSSKIDIKNLKAKLSLDKNPYYDLGAVEIKQDCIVFSIKELQQHIKLPLEYKLQLRIFYDKKNNPFTFFTPETLNFTILNQGVRKITIKEIK